MPISCDPKIQVSVNLSPRTVTMLSEEAKRLGISFSDQVRRITDGWGDAQIKKQEKVPEKILVLDRDTGSLRSVR